MKRGTRVGIAAGVAAVVVIGGGIAWWMLTPPSPEDAAREFLAALERGDGARAMSLVADPPATAEHAAAALADAEALIEDPIVDGVDGDGDHRRAAISFTTGGGPDRATSEIGLVSIDGVWKIAPDALGDVTADATLGDAVRISGILLPAGEPVSLLPGVYEVTAAPAALLAGSAGFGVAPGASIEITVDAALSPAATARAQEQLDAYAAQCTATAAGVPDHCGLRVPWAADLARLDSLSYRIEQTPAVTLSPGDGTFAATGGVVVATATGTRHDGTAGSFTYRADDWALRGSLAFTGDEMVLAVD